jgi:endonuclease I
MLAWMQRLRGAVLDAYAQAWVQAPSFPDPGLIMGKARQNASLRALQALGLNCEHRWPVSLGGPRADLLNITATDIDANCRRSRFPYGTVVEVRWTNGKSKLGLNAEGIMVFETAEDDKGLAARSMLGQLVLRGPEQARKVGGVEALRSALQLDVQIPVLRTWHAEHPVTDLEALLNDASWQEQGHRNPFVDYPELVERIADFLAGGVPPPSTRG